MFLIRNSVADFLVDRGADALGKAFIVERSRNRVHGDCRLIDDPVDLLCAHAGTDLLRHRVQAGHVDLGALLNTLDLFRRLDDASVRRYMSLKLEGLDLIVKTHVTVLVFLSAAAPARIISFNLSCKMDHKLLTSFCFMVSLQTILMQRNYESFFCNCQARSACTHKAIYDVQKKTPAGTVGSACQGSRNAQYSPRKKS